MESQMHQMIWFQSGKVVFIYAINSEY